MNTLKKIVLDRVVVLTDSEVVDGQTIAHNVTNHPGAELALPVDEADALIKKGDAHEWVEPTDADTSSEAAAPAAQAVLDIPEHDA